MKGQLFIYHFTRATVDAMTDVTTDKTMKLWYKDTGECSFFCIYLAFDDGEVVIVRHPNSSMFLVAYTVVTLIMPLLVFPHSVFAECKEFKIVEYEDRVEVVCVGNPPTEAEKKAALAEQRRQEQETQRQKAIELNLQREEAAKANKAKADAAAAAAKAAAEHKKQSIPPTTPKQIQDKNLINIKNL